MIAAAVPGVIAARRVGKVHEEVRTNHGIRAGDYVEGTAFMVGVLDTKIGELRADFTAHTLTDERNFTALNAGQDEIRGEQARVADALALKNEEKS